MLAIGPRLKALAVLHRQQRVASRQQLVASTSPSMSSRSTARAVSSFNDTSSTSQQLATSTSPSTPTRSTARAVSFNAYGVPQPRPHAVSMSFELDTQASLEPLDLDEMLWIDAMLWMLLHDLKVRDDDLLQKALLLRDTVPLRDDPLGPLARDRLRRRNALLPARDDESSAAIAHSLTAPPPPPRRLKQ
jgi:hypothetical protein